MLVSDPRNEIHVSSASVWEIAMKHALYRGRPSDIPISGPEALAKSRELKLGKPKKQIVGFSCIADQLCFFCSMADDANNLVLEHLRAIRGDTGELRRRFANIEAQLVQQGRLIAILVDGQNHLRSRFAEVETRIDRIAARLGLIEV